MIYIFVCFCFVCLFVFSSTSKNTLKTLSKWYQNNGLTPVHRKTPKNTRASLPFELYQAIQTYILNYAEEHALQLPGRIAGYNKKSYQFLLLPSAETKIKVYDSFIAARGKPGMTLCLLYQAKTIK